MRVKLAPGLFRLQRASRQHARATQPIKVPDTQITVALNRRPQRIVERSIALQRRKHSSKVVREHTLILISLGFHLCEIDTASGHFIESALRQVWMPPDQRVKPRHFLLITKRPIVAAVELRDLLDSEVFECQSSADVERRLVE